MNAENQQECERHHDRRQQIQRGEIVEPGDPAGQRPGQAQRQIKTRMFYPYISDSSFMAVCDDTLAIQALETNMPQYGVKYTHPVDKIRQIDVPVVNIGTFGRDGHMLTERVDMRQTFQNVPNITYEAVKRLLS